LAAPSRARLASLITPGGIATGTGRTGAPPAPGRSSPLEGSQHVELPVQVGFRTSRSSPLEGSQRAQARVGDRPADRSSPLEGL